MVEINYHEVRRQQQWLRFTYTSIRRKRKKQTRAYFLNILANMCCRRRRPVVQDLFRPVSRPS